jgi:uncharacterized membrane protein YebE (DUF533 family)
MRHVLLLLGVALAASTGGCAMSLPETVPYPSSAPTTADPAPGMSFCARTEEAARSLSGAQAGGGWTLGSLGAASLGTGIITTLVNDQTDRRIAGAALTLGGVALGVVAYTLFLRSQTSGRLAEAANLAMLEKDDRRAYESCVRAKAAWAGAKSDPEGITREMLDQRERENRKLHDEIEQLGKKGPDDSKAPLPPPLAPRP